jgi:hypothetical protein
MVSTVIVLEYVETFNSLFDRFGIIFIKLMPKHKQLFTNNAYFLQK